MLLVSEKHKEFTCQEIDGNRCVSRNHSHCPVWNTRSAKETSPVQVNEELADCRLDIATLVEAVKDGGRAVNDECGIDVLEPWDPGVSVDSDVISRQLIIQVSWNIEPH